MQSNMDMKQAITEDDQMMMEDNEMHKDTTLSSCIQILFCNICFIDDFDPSTFI